MSPSPDFPGSALPKTAQSLQWLMRLEETLTHLEDRYGPTFQVRFLRDMPWVLISDPTDVAAALALPRDAYRPGTEVFRPALGTRGLLTLSGDEHLRHRKMILPMFADGRVDALRPMMREVAEEYLTRLDGDITFVPIAEDAALEVLVRAVFGERDDEVIAGMNEVKSTYKGVQLILRQAFFGGDSRYVLDRIRRTWLPFRELLQRRVDERRVSAFKREDMLGMLLDARDGDGVGFTDRELSDELVMLLFSGHETTAKAMAWTLGLLLENGMVDDARTSEPFLRASIQESLRCRVIVPDPSRRLLVPVTLPSSGLTAPRGVRLCLNVHAIHRDPQRWTSPERFLPERFLDATPSRIDYLPFGGGGRRCLGSHFALLEAETMLGTFLNAKVFRKRRGPERPVRDAITLAPNHGTAVAASPRSPNP